MSHSFQRRKVGKKCILNTLGIFTYPCRRNSSVHANQICRDADVVSSRSKVRSGKFLTVEDRLVLYSPWFRHKITFTFHDYLPQRQPGYLRTTFQPRRCEIFGSRNSGQKASTLSTMAARARRLTEPPQAHCGPEEALAGGRCRVPRGFRGVQATRLFSVPIKLCKMRKLH